MTTSLLDVPSQTRFAIVRKHTFLSHGFPPKDGFSIHIYINLSTFYFLVFCFFPFYIFSFFFVPFDPAFLGMLW